MFIQCLLGNIERNSLKVYATMFLPTTISDTAVKRAFSEFGNVYTVLAGKYGE